MHKSCECEAIFFLLNDPLAWPVSRSWKKCTFLISMRFKGLNQQEAHNEPLAPPASRRWKIPFYIC